MTQAHDCLSLSNDPTLYITSLKRILRFIADGDVLLTFSDGSRLKYRRNVNGWRFDTLEIITDET